MQTHCSACHLDQAGINHCSATGECICDLGWTGNGCQTKRVVAVTAAATEDGIIEWNWWWWWIVLLGVLGAFWCAYGLCYNENWAKGTDPRVGDCTKGGAHCWYNAWYVVWFFWLCGHCCRGGGTERSQSEGYYPGRRVENTGCWYKTWFTCWYTFLCGCFCTPPVDPAYDEEYDYQKDNEKRESYARRPPSGMDIAPGVNKNQSEMEMKKPPSESWGRTCGF